ncbi:MAG: hypothetical protein ABI234_15585 [Ktedonobacteraceae bacterium]
MTPTPPQGADARSSPSSELQIYPVAVCIIPEHLFKIAQFIGIFADIARKNLSPSCISDNLFVVAILPEDSRAMQIMLL